jgi:hypothetical protein
LAAVVAVEAAIVEEVVAAAARLTTGRFSSFSANLWILK